jgi:hypothetical protein
MQILSFLRNQTKALFTKAPQMNKIYVEAYKPDIPALILSAATAVGDSLMDLCTEDVIPRDPRLISIVVNGPFPRLFLEFTIITPIAYFYEAVYQHINDHECCFWLTHKGKPLNERAIAAHYNFHEGDCIQFNLGMRGGSDEPQLAKLERSLRREYGQKTGRKIFKAIISSEDQIQSFSDFDMIGKVKEAAYAALLANSADPTFVKIMKIAGTTSGQGLIKMAENLILLIINLTQAETKAQKALAMIGFIKMSHTGPLLTGTIFAQMAEFYTQVFGPMEVQSVDSMLLSADDLLHKYERIRDHPVFVKFYRFGMYALSLSLFAKAGVTFDALRFGMIEREAIKKKYHMGADFFHSVAETLLFVCKRGYQCMVTGDLSPIFHSEDEYGKWAEKVRELKRDSLIMGNPEPHGKNSFSYLADIDSAIEQGEAIFKYASRLGQFEKKLISTLLNDVRLLKALEVTKRSAQMERKAPFSVLLFGGSSVGKSTLTKLLFYHYGKIMNLPTSSEFKYTRNCIDKNWSGFNSAKWCILLDDIAFLNPNFAAAGDPSLLEMIQVVNFVPFVTTQAELADKGRTPLRAKLVIATTNTEHLNAYAYFACPLAVQRRLPWIIDVVPKDEYLKDGCMLDSSKTPPVEEGCYPDFWRFTIKRVIPVGTDRLGQKAAYEEVAIYENIYEFLQWYSKEALLHEKQQNMISDCDGVMSTAQLCETCFIPTKHCTCVEVQSRFLPDRSLRQWMCNLDKDDVPIPETLEAALAREAREAEARDRTNLEREAKLAMRLQHVLTYWYSLRNVSLLGWIISFFCDLMAFVMLEISFFRRWTSWWYTFPITRIFIQMVVAGSSKKIRYGTHLLRWTGRRIRRRMHSNVFLSYVWEITEMAVRMAVINIMVYVAMLAVIKFAAKFGKKKKKGKTQVSEIEIVDSSTIGKAPKDKEEEQNVWHKDDYQTTTFDVNPMNCSYKSLSKEQVIETLSRNTVRLVIRRVQTINGLEVPVKRETNAICLAGHIYLCNNHSFPEDECFKMEIITSNAKDGVTPNTSCLMTQSEICRIPESDLAFFKMVCLPPKKDIRSLFCKDTLNGGFNATYISRNLNGVIQTRSIRAVKLAKNDSIVQLDAHTDVWYGTVDENTVYGDCGSMMLADSAFGPIILGIHVLGDGEGLVGSIRVTQERIEDSIKFFKGPVIQAGTPMLSAPSALRVLGDLHRKSTLRWIPEGSAECYGSFLGLRARHKSNVAPTFIQKSVVAQGYEIKCGRPKMDSWEPWNRALTDLSKPVTLMRPDILEHCAEAYTKDILDRLTPEDLEDVFVYDDVTAVNGAVGVKYVDKINRNTSMGAPWKKSKKYFMTAIPPTQGLADPVEMAPEVMERVNQLITTYKSGCRGMVVYTGSLKDEALPFAKIAINKIRLFMSGPVDSTIVTRKYYLSLIRLVQRNRFIFEAAPGTIAQSSEWGEIREYLCAHGHGRMVAGDYVSFDKRMPPSIILKAFGILISIMKAAGGTTDDENVMWGIAMDTAYPLVDFSGDLLQLYGSNPSGHALTVIINSLANSLYMRYAYTVMNPSKTCWDFKSYVNLMTYGDDNAMGVSLDRSWFNHTSIQASLAAIGVGYTMADKKAQSVPFIHIDNVSFLKRTWRYDDDVGAWLCPLEHESIEKMLTVCVTSKTITPQEQAVCILNTAAREYFFYGKTIFEERRKMIMEIIKENDIWVYMDCPIPTWDKLKEDFWTYSPKPNEEGVL